MFSQWDFIEDPFDYSLHWIWRIRTISLLTLLEVFGDFEAWNGFP